jgi:hypothetical protein
MTHRIHLDDLRNGCSGILPSLGSFMCDCAIYSLATQGHSSGVILDVETDSGHLKYSVTWEGGVSTQMLRTLNDEVRATDYGAMCLALLLVFQLTEYQSFIMSVQGTGIDFWLFLEEPPVVDTAKADARLEISGIRTASKTNTIKIRHKMKKEQVKQSDFTGLDVYIAITEFSKPNSLFLKS